MQTVARASSYDAYRYLIAYQPSQHNPLSSIISIHKNCQLHACELFNPLNKTGELTDLLILKC